MTEPLLRVEDITVSFDGFKALDGMSLQLIPKQVRVLIGPNGAGKSTLLDTIIGRVRPTAGRVIFQGQEITRLPEHEIVRKGICRKFQAPGILESLTVMENLTLAARPNRGWLHSLNRTSPSEVQRDTAEILHLIGLEEKRDALAARMSHAEAEETAALIRKLSEWHSVLVIDHDMAFVALLDAPVTVLHLGRLLREGTLDEIRRDPQVTAVYLGRGMEAKHAQG